MFPFLLIAVAIYVAGTISSKAITLVSAETRIDVAELYIDGSFGNFLLGTAPIVLPMDVINTKPGSLAVQGFTGQLLFADSVIATIIHDNPAILPPNGVLRMDIPIYLNPGEAAGAIVQLIGAGAVPQLVIKGTLTVERIPIPINQTISLAV